MKKLSSLALRATFWSYASFALVKAFNLLTVIIIARFLPQEEMGVASYAVVVVAILEVINDFGISPALIYYRDEPTATDTAFWLGLAASLILLAMTWFLSPAVSLFFHDPRAANVTLVLALTLPLIALGNVHDAILRRDLSFGLRMFPDLARVLAKGTVSIWMAWLGWGAWSLILGQLAGTAMRGIALWRIVPWRPRFVVDRTTAHALMSYGFSIVCVSVLGALLRYADFLFIGRYLGAVALGSYSLAYRLTELSILQSCYVVSQVMFPTYVRLEDSPEKLRKGICKVMRFVSMLTIPAGLGIVLVADPLIRSLFTDRWLDAIPIIRATAVYTMIFSIAFNMGDAYKAQGRPDILTKLGLLRAAILLPALWWTASHGGSAETIAWVHAVVAGVLLVVQLTVANRMLSLSWREMESALRPAVVCGGLMAIAVWFARNVTREATATEQLCTCVLIGMLSYVGLLWIFFRDALIGVQALYRRAS